MEDPTKRHIAIIGGGISGLSSAYYAVNSDPNCQVTVIEESNRFGGKIQSVDTSATGKSWADRGAEFVDSDQTTLVDLCKQLGVNLVPTGFDNTDELFRLPDGKTMDADSFYKAVEPLKKKIAADKKTIEEDPSGKRAQHLDNISLEQYINELTLKTKGQPILTKIKFLAVRFGHWVKRDHGVNADVAQTLAACYTSECGNDPKDASALQFVREASHSLDALVDSDCAYRIEGGSETLIKALHTHLEQTGRVNFQTNTRVTGVKKQFDDTFALATATPDGQQGSAQADQIIFALPSYALKNVRGIDSLGQAGQGFNQNDLGLINDLQYTHSSKFTVKLKDGNTLGDVAMFSHDGWQAWRGPAEDSVTFLVGGRTFNDQKAGKTLVNYCLDEFAKSNNTTPQELFDASQQIIFGGPSTKACYASPAPKQAEALSTLTQKNNAMAAKTGAALAGTYLDPDNGIGFMNNGVESAMQAVLGLNAEAKARSQAQLSQPQRQPGYHVEKYATRNPALVGAGMSK